MDTKKDLLKIEWVGSHVKVIGSKNKTYMDIEGMIADETKHTFTILSKNTRKKVLKAQCVFEISVKMNTYKVDGKLLEKRSEERIKIK